MEQEKQASGLDHHPAGELARHHVVGSIDGLLQGQLRDVILVIDRQAFMHPLPGGGAFMPAVGGGEGEKVRGVHVDAPYVLVGGCAGGGRRPWLSPGACPPQG